eukprot:c20530_g1_i5.p5 GENE.c20530_g1_i5~~c20530_g1_i5.p5  ORF type:complete len:155 (+),score=26.83 c20530_g1_i5:1840-2304(+)
MFKGGPLVWTSKLQATVAMSSMEAEFMAASAAATEAIYLVFLGEEMGLPFEQPIRLCMDNLGALQMAENPAKHSRAKHINLRVHYLREKVKEGLVELNHVSTNDNRADMLTKPLARIKFQLNVEAVLDQGKVQPSMQSSLHEEEHLNVKEERVD